MKVITEKQYRSVIRRLKECAENHLEDAKNEAGIDNIAHHIKASVLKQIAESMEEAIFWDS